MFIINFIREDNKKKKNSHPIHVNIRRLPPTFSHPYHDDNDDDEMLLSIKLRAIFVRSKRYKFTIATYTHNIMITRAMNDKAGEEGGEGVMLEEGMENLKILRTSED